MSYFLEPYGHNKNKIKVELDLSNYARKPHLKGTTDIDKSKFTKKNDLSTLKAQVDKTKCRSTKSCFN